MVSDELVLGEGLTLEEVMRASRGEVRLSWTDGAREKVSRCRTALHQAIQDGGVFYGINTGFADNRTRGIRAEDMAALQLNLIRSHAAGVGEWLPREIVRGALVIRAHGLSKGYSGVRPELVDALLALYNSGIVPAVPEFGSVGASGDLAPLSHLALVLLGEGEVLDDSGLPQPAAPALARHRLSPMTLEFKEGLALNNGTAFMASQGIWAVSQAERLADTADLLVALQLEAQWGVGDAFLKEVHRLRPHPEVRISAARIASFVRGSTLLGKREGDPQDDYCLRCAPQVHGTSRAAFLGARNALQVELESVTDNPVIFPDFDGTGGVRVVSAGHFHGEPLAQPLDGVKLALTELASISERRVAKVVHGGGTGRNHGLPNYLVAGDDEAGLRSGFMIAQYCAAALVNECKTLAHPHSADSIPTGNSAEDHVSMGANAARSARILAERVTEVLGIELVVACQALEMRRLPAFSRGGVPGKVAAAVLEEVRRSVSFLRVDQPLSPLLKEGAEWVRSGRLLTLDPVKKAVGDIEL